MIAARKKAGPPAALSVSLYDVKPHFDPGPYSVDFSRSVGYISVERLGGYNGIFSIIIHSM